MDGYRFCGLPDALVTEDLRRNPLGRWWVTKGLTRASRDTVRAQLQESFDAWGDVADVAGEEARSEDTADLLVEIHIIDRAGGVLADQQLPGPRVQIMRLDDSEKWVVQAGVSIARGVIDLGRVIKHEQGHYWGMGHAPQDSANLMAPIYSTSTWLPTGSWEREWMLREYGAPKPRPPRPVPMPGNRTTIVLTGVDRLEILAINAESIAIPGYKVVKEG